MGMDDFSPIGLIGGAIGGLLAVYISGGMTSGIVTKVLTFLGTAVVCYFVSNAILDN